MSPKLEKLQQDILQSGKRAEENIKEIDDIMQYNVRLREDLQAVLKTLGEVQQQIVKNIT